MKFENYVVVKENGKWMVGKIKGYKFTPYQDVKKLSDVKDVSSYISLTQYIKKNKFKPSLAKLLLKKTGLQSIYILSKPAYLDEDEWDSYWWYDYCKKCRLCINKCKQSHFAEIVVCPNYERKK